LIKRANQYKKVSLLEKVKFPHNWQNLLKKGAEKMEKKKITIKSISLSTITGIIDVISAIINQFETWHDIWRNRQLKKKHDRALKEAEKALKDKDVKKINDIIHRM